MPEIRIKRGTRSQVSTAAAASGLAAGELYLITDESRVDVGTSVSASTALAKKSEVDAKQDTITASGILKGAGAGSISAATAGTDYAAPGSTTTYTVVQNFAASGITLKGSSTGTTTFASANSSAANYTITFPASTGTVLTSGGSISGGIPYFTNTGYGSSVQLAANAIVVGGGVNAAPSTITTGTGVVTALGVNTGTAGAFVVNGGALGTPSSGTVTNLTGTASININGTVGATTPTTGAFTSVTSTSASGILTRAAATQDGVELIGRAGGTTSLKVTFTPTTLTASRTLTLPDLSGTVATTTGADGLFTRWMFQDTGWDFHDSGTTNALDYVNGSVQRWAPNTGAQTLSITNWPPSGAMGELLIQGVNLGAATITWPTINWIKSDGTTTTTFSSNGVTLQASGTDWVFLWTRDAGTTIYGKVVR